MRAEGRGTRLPLARELRRSLLTAVWFMLLTFPILVIQVNTVEKTIRWRWANMLWIGLATFLLSLPWR